jgi:hypothetical protein
VNGFCRGHSLRRTHRLGGRVTVRRCPLASRRLAKLQSTENPRSRRRWAGHRIAIFHQRRWKLTRLRRSRTTAFRRPTEELELLHASLERYDGSVSPLSTNAGITAISIAAIRCSVVVAVPSALKKTSRARTSTGLISASARAGTHLGPQFFVLHCKKSPCPRVYWGRLDFTLG